jgi:heme-degrading monooxygenase HmoA
MYATIRTYSDGPQFAEQLAARSADIEEVISTVPGFQSYFLVRTQDGCATITVCEDKAGCDESTKRASQWLREHASEIKSTPPKITSGEVLFQIGATARV